MAEARHVLEAMVPEGLHPSGHVTEKDMDRGTVIIGSGGSRTHHRPQFRSGGKIHTVSHIRYTCSLNSGGTPRTVQPTRTAQLPHTAHITINRSSTHNHYRFSNVERRIIGK